MCIESKAAETEEDSEQNAGTLVYESGEEYSFTIFGDFSANNIYSNYSYGSNFSVPLDFEMITGHSYRLVFDDYSSYKYGLFKDNEVSVTSSTRPVSNAIMRWKNSVMHIGGQDFSLALQAIGSKGALFPQNEFIFECVSGSDLVFTNNTIYVYFLFSTDVPGTAHLERTFYIPPFKIYDISSRSEKEVLESIESETKKSNEIAEETKETTKGIFGSIKEFFGSFFDNLIESVIGLFVPSTEEMGDLFGQLNDFFSDRFGFLYAPFDYMIQLLGVFTSSTGTTGITFPGFSIMGYEVWPDITYDLASEPLVGDILGYVRIGTGVLLAGYFIMFLQDFFKERFSK